MRRAFSRGLVAAAAASALVLSACGGDDNGGGDTGGGGEQPASVKIGFMGDLTGATQPRHRHPARTAPSWRSTSTTRPTRTAKIELKQLRLARARPSRPPRWPSRRSTTDKIVGLVGPAFSGESQRGRPDLRRGRPPHHLGVGDQPDPGREGLDDLPPRSSATTRPRAPAVGDFISTAGSAKKVFVIDDHPSTARASPTIVTTALGRRRDGRDRRHRSSRAVRLLLHRHQGQAVRRRRDLLRRLLRRGRPAAQAAARGRRDGTVRVRRRLAGPGLRQGRRRRRRRGRGRHLPVRPAGEARAATFAEDYKAKFGTAPATYSAEGYDAANVFLDGDRRPATPTARTCSTFLNDVRRPGRHQADQVRRRTVSSAGGDVYVYKVEGPG